jgi:DNA (cytosine-5)-methyltransferase 1
MRNGLGAFAAAMSAAEPHLGENLNGGDSLDLWPTEPDVGRVAHGIPARVDRLKGLGNAIVPQCALVIFQAIQAREAVIRAA